MSTYFVHYFDERTGTGDCLQVTTPEVNDALPMAERTGITYTTAQVSTDPYGIDVLAEYGDPTEDR